MSFSFSFVAATKAQARELLARQHAPANVKDFVRTAIDNLVDADERSPRVISVKANGHLCDSQGSYSTSTANVEVVPLPIGAS